ncbi:MAG: lysylphosphatidylglycerol synthase transmembrane domain-containing protein [Niabella sp.]
MQKKLKTIFRFLIFLGLGLFLVWWSVKDLSPADLSHIKSAVREVKTGWLLPGALVVLFSHFARAVRWKLLIEPMGYKPSTSNMFFAVMIGYLANQAVPRLGEILKCTSLARYEKIPADKLFGTVILERVFDTICLGIVFVLTLALQPDLYDRILLTFFPKNNEPFNGHTGFNLLLYGVGALVLLLAVFFIYVRFIRKSRKRSLTRSVKVIIARFWQGLTTIRHLKKRGAFVIWSLVIWTCYTLAGYIGFLALQETSHLGIREALMVLCAGSVGMIATPGGIGAYPFIVQKTLLLYQIDHIIALAFGWLLWLVQTGVILLFGFAGTLLMPWYSRRKQRSA